MDEIIEIVDRINILKKEQGKTSGDISKMSGIPLGTLNKILSMESKAPTINSIIKIAHALGVTADYLVYGYEAKQTEQPISNQEKELLKDFRNLNEEGQEKVRDYVSDLLYSGKYEKNSSVGLVSKKQA